MEMPGYGVMGNLAEAILDNVNGSTSEAVDYPALLEPYDTSSYAGVVATTKQLTSHVDNCPKGKVILLGYSQVRPPEISELGGTA
jgi:acetylxylan esterase